MERQSSETEYRRELRTRILETSLSMFRSQGLKAVRMDDISKAMGISKRTLYEIYPNKEDLIFESIRTGFCKSKQRLRERLSDSSDTMDVLSEFFKIRIEETRGTSSLLLDDMRHYPKINAYFEEHKVDHTAQVLQFFARGQDEGYFLRDANMQLIRELNAAISDYFVSSRLYLKYDTKDILRTLMLLFVRSICTPAGIRRIDELLETM